jgi:hypothetical protein
MLRRALSFVAMPLVVAAFGAEILAWGLNQLRRERELQRRATAAAQHREDVRLELAKARHCAARRRHWGPN